MRASAVMVYGSKDLRAVLAGDPVMMWSGSRSEVTEMHELSELSELSEPGGGAGTQMYGELCVIMAVRALFAKK